MTEVENPASGAAETPRVMTFGHLEIAHDSRVLSPRPWTRAQSAWAADRLEELPAGEVLELCSGAGHIGLLAVAGTSRHLVQVDASEAACELARLNADRAAAADGAAAAGWSVEVRHGLLEQALRPEERFVLVIADPPWVPAADTHRHPDDPLTAIDGGQDGLDLVRSSLTVIGRHLTDAGEALLQVGDLAQAEAVARYVDARPHLGLSSVGHRALDDGTLVHLVRRG